MVIRVDLGDFEILEKISSRFGNSAHILVSKELIGKKLKIIFGASKIKNKEIQIDFPKSEILERKATRFGTGAHVIVPREYSRKKLKIIFGGKNE